MDYRPLGNTGVKVSKFCLGAMMFGAWGNTDHDDCVRITHAALDAGINFIDTADAYGAGESEAILAKALRGRRDDVVLATKCHLAMGPDPNHQGSSRRWIMRACDDSLRRLDTDYIDLFQMHRLQAGCDHDETLGALTDLVRAGKVRYLGTSTYPPSAIVEAQWVAERRGRERFVCEQPPYSLLYRGVEYDALPTCQRYGMGVIPWGPLGGGWLSGRWRKGAMEMESSRANRVPMRYDLSRPSNQRKLDAVEDLTLLAEDAGLSLIHLALAFVLNHPAITAAILGPRTMEHFESQIGAADVKLATDVLDRIDKIVLPGTNINPADAGYSPPAITNPKLRRRAERGSRLPPMWQCGDMSSRGTEFDLVVRGGLVVDGSGTPGARGDVAVVGDRVVAVGEVEGRGREELEVDGMVVAPGFVDAHTHMDAQVFWDDLGKPTCWHGVTSVVMGNCGFTLAPAREDARALVVRNLERAEDIAPEAMAEGIKWTWSTFAEFLDAVDTRPKGLNHAAAIGHSALRTWVMGERAFDEAANEDDLVAMARELRAALGAGAAGFTTSRTLAHVTSDDRPVASRQASWGEVVALVEILGRESNGVFQLAPERLFDPDAHHDFEARLAELAIFSGAPIVFGLFSANLPQPSLELMEETAARGGDLYGLTHCRGVVSAQSFRTRLGFDCLPEWRDVRLRPYAEQHAMLRDPDVRRRLVHAAHHGDYSRTYGPEAGRPKFDRMTILQSPCLPNPTVADEARQAGVDPVELMIDVALENDFDVFFLQHLMDQDDDELLRLMRHPRTAMCFSDSGAHVSQIFDSSIYTYLLAYWVRERQAMTLEAAIQMMTSRPADIWRLRGRGRLAPGYAADITIFDPDTVAPAMPYVVEDLPGKAKRIEQHAVGFVATIVNGEVLIRDGEATDARPGRLLRAQQAT